MRHILWNPSYPFHHRLRSRGSYISARETSSWRRSAAHTQRRDNCIGEAVGRRVSEAGGPVLQDDKKTD